jgi:hypothetical protein
VNGVERAHIDIEHYLAARWYGSITEDSSYTSPAVLFIETRDAAAVERYLIEGATGASVDSRSFGLESDPEATWLSGIIPTRTRCHGVEGRTDVGTAAAACVGPGW